MSHKYDIMIYTSRPKGASHDEYCTLFFLSLLPVGTPSGEAV